MRSIRTIDRFRVALEPLNDACVRLKTALSQLIQVVNHVVVRLQHNDTRFFNFAWTRLHQQFQIHMYRVRPNTKHSFESISINQL